MGDADDGGNRPSEWRLQPALLQWGFCRQEALVTLSHWVRPLTALPCRLVLICTAALP